MPNALHEPKPVTVAEALEGLATWAAEVREWAARWQSCPLARYCPNSGEGCPSC